MKKMYSLVALVSITLLVSACHKNPLKKYSKTKGAIFLVTASFMAEKNLNLKIKPDDRGAMYCDCMEGKAKAVDCKALYKAMVDYASLGKHPDFKGIRFKDLTDPYLYEDLRNWLDEALLTTDLESMA